MMPCPPLVPFLSRRALPALAGELTTLLAGELTGGSLWVPVAHSTRSFVAPLRVALSAPPPRSVSYSSVASRTDWSTPGPGRTPPPFSSPPIAFSSIAFGFRRVRSLGLRSIDCCLFSFRPGGARFRSGTAPPRMARSPDAGRFLCWRSGLYSTYPSSGRSFWRR